MGDDDFCWRDKLARGGQTLLRAIAISPPRATGALTPRSREGPPLESIACGPSRITLNFDRAGVLNGRE